MFLGNESRALGKQEDVNRLDFEWAARLFGEGHRLAKPLLDLAAASANERIFFPRVSATVLFLHGLPTPSLADAARRFVALDRN